MSRASRLLTVAVSLALPVAASANGWSPVERGSQKQADATLASLADCLATRKTGQAWTTAFLRRAPGERLDDRWYRDLNLEGCMPRSFLRTQLRFRPPLLRGALYQAMYRHQFGRADAASTPLTTRGYAGEIDGASPDEAERFAAMRELGDCSVRRDPADARALVLSPVGSAAEVEATKGMGAAMGGCVDTGQAMHLSLAMLRGVVAEALYKASVGGAGA